MNRWPHSKTSLLSSSDRLDALHTAYSSRAAVELFIYFGLWDREVESSRSVPPIPFRAKTTPQLCSVHATPNTDIQGPREESLSRHPATHKSRWFTYPVLDSLFFCNRCQKLSRRIACFNATMRYALPRRWRRWYCRLQGRKMMTRNNLRREAVKRKGESYKLIVIENKALPSRDRTNFVWCLPAFYSCLCAVYFTRVKQLGEGDQTPFNRVFGCSSILHRLFSSVFMSFNYKLPHSG